MPVCRPATGASTIRPSVVVLQRVLVHNPAKLFGYDEAAAWVAGRLESLGLKPGGDNGTFYQEFPNPYTLVLPGGGLRFAGQPTREVGNHVLVRTSETEGAKGEKENPNERISQAQF